MTEKSSFTTAVDAHDNIDIWVCRKVNFLMIPNAYIYVFNTYLCHNCTL